MSSCIMMSNIESDRSWYRDWCRDGDNYTCKMCITLRNMGKVGSVWNFVLGPASISSAATYIVNNPFYRIQVGKKKLLNQRPTQLCTRNE